MKSLLKGNFIVKYKSKEKSTIFWFSLGNKISRATCKSLRSPSQDLHVTHGILFSKDEKK